LDRHRRKVELLGGGLTIGDVPPHDPAAERWGLNRLMFSRYAGNFTDWHRWFDLHSTAHILRYRPDAYAWYTQQPANKPIYRWAHDAALPGCCVYPRERVADADERDFACSLAWMFALAIAEGFDDIDCFWFVVDPNEPAYRDQIASVRYWIGRARGAGLRVTIHGDSFLKPSGRLYGYES